jgi:hypothetical protein
MKSTQSVGRFFLPKAGGAADSPADAQINGDGSRTLYAGATSPGEDKESNWPSRTVDSRSTFSPIGPIRPSSAANGCRRRCNGSLIAAPRNPHS